MLKDLSLSIPQYGEFKTSGGIPTGGLSTTGGKIIQTGIGIAFLFAIILCLFVIIWGGVAWISSGGDKQKLATARSRIMYSIVGLIIVLLSFLIVNFFTSFLGLPSPYGQSSPSKPSAADCANSPNVGRCLREDRALTSPKPNEPPTITRIYNQTQDRVVFQFNRSGVPSQITPVKEGDVILISFTAPDISGQFEWGISGRADDKSSGACSSNKDTVINDCTVEYTVPTNAPITAKFYVLDLTTGKSGETPLIPIQ